jgi:fructose-specific phosphotransferase system IIC component
VQMVLLLVGLRLRMGPLQGRAILRSAIRTVVASAVAGVVACWAVRVVSSPGPTGALARALPGLVGMVGFLVAFAVGAWVMRAPELEQILTPVRRRLGRTQGAR